MAVYTKVSDEDAKNLLARYDIGAFQGLVGIQQGISNSNFILNTNTDDYILTLYETRTKADDLPFFMGLMEHLVARGIPCPKPIHAKDGTVIQSVAGRPAAIVSFLKGKPLTRIEAADCAEMGRALAHLHNASADFPMHRANDLSLDGWDALFKPCALRADEVQAGLGQLLGDELSFLHSAWPRNLPAGVIHADLFPDNTFFDGGKLCGIIDFYFACNDLYAYEVAVCLNAWCFEANNVSFNLTKARAFLDGYRSARPFAPDELRALPILARGASVRFLLTRLYDWLHRVPGALVRPKNPLEYLDKLQFHQRVQDVREYGII